MPRFSSVHGRRLGLGDTGQLAAQGGSLDITQPAADAVVTVSDETTNVRTITIQLKDADGNDIAYVEMVDVWVFLDNARVAVAATGGSTGIEIGTDGAIADTPLAKKHFVCLTEADGDLDLTWTDTGTEVAFIGVRLPSGRFVMGSQALTNAA